jgi:hypothetical protein
MLAVKQQVPDGKLVFSISSVPACFCYWLSYCHLSLLDPLLLLLLLVYAKRS